MYLVIEGNTVVFGDESISKAIGYAQHRRDVVIINNKNGVVTQVDYKAFPHVKIPHWSAIRGTMVNFAVVNPYTGFDIIQSASTINEDNIKDMIDQDVDTVVANGVCWHLVG